MADSNSSTARAERFLSKGIDLFRAQAEGGGVRCEAAKKFTGAPVFIFPPNVEEIEQYMDDKGFFNANVFLARAKDEHNMHYFTKPGDKAAMMQEFRTRIKPDDLKDAVNEILLMYGEYTRKQLGLDQEDEELTGRDEDISEYGQGATFPGDIDPGPADEPTISLDQDGGAPEPLPTVDEAEKNS